MPPLAATASSAQIVPAGARSSTAPLAWVLRSASSCFFEAPGGNGWPMLLSTRLCVLASNAYHCSEVAPAYGCVSGRFLAAFSSAYSVGR